MKRTLSFAMLACLIMATGCQEKEPVVSQLRSKAIKAKVSSAGMTKSGAADGAGKLVATYPLSDDSGSPLFLHVYEADINENYYYAPVTKGTEVKTGNIQEFSMKAYAEGDWQEGPAGLYYPAMRWSRENTTSSTWESSEERNWLNDVPLTFWSWNEVEPEVVFSDGTDHASLSGYTVSQTVTSQKDLVYAYNRESRSFDGLGGIRDGKSPSVDITFYHALSEINFDISGVASEYTISKIQLSNIHSGGDCAITVVDGVPTFAWPSEELAEKTSYSQTFGTSDFSADGRYAEGSNKNFFLIPQVLPPDASMSVTFSSDGSDETLTRSISTNSGGAVRWLPGKRYTYKLSKSAYTYDYTFEFIDDEGQPEVSVRQAITDNKDDYGTVFVELVSTKERDDAQGTATHQGWKIKSYKLDGEDEVTVNSASFTDQATGITAEAFVSEDCIIVDASPRDRIGRGSHTFWTDQSRTEDRGWSPESWFGQGVIDLSRMDYTKDAMSQSVNAFEMTTANCYVIRHAGRYKLPLVYGNAVYCGQYNEMAYYPNADGSVPNGDTATDSKGDIIRLVRFENHLGNGITDPFIENNAGCVMSAAEILWQSDADVIKDISFTGAVAGHYDKQNVRYIEFTVDPDVICQNESLIAVRDTSGNVAWSWNIWTTNDPALTEGSIEVRNYDGNPYRFFPIPSIGRVETYEYIERKTMQITLQQEASDKVIVLTIEQPKVSGPGFCALFQFGRKDPFVNTNNIHSYSPSLSGAISYSVPPPQATPGQYICNPTTFYEFRIPSYSSPLENLYLNLWTGKSCDSGLAEQNPSIIKTVYDPSPIGYKVPAGKAFTGFTTTGDNLWKIGLTHDPANEFMPERVNGFWDSGDNAYFYTSQGVGHTVNTGGETIWFPATKIRAGGTGNISNDHQGWYYTSNVSKTTSQYGPNVQIYLLTTEFSNGELIQLRPVTIAGHNAHGLRPVIDVTMPNNPIQ